jgi:drug/metabolite transporter (DMT)-like permease
MTVLAGHTRAILWMLLGAACVVAMSAVIKHLAGELPVAMVFFFRMAFALLLVLPWVARHGPAVLATRRLREHFVRGAVGDAAE